MPSNQDRLYVALYGQGNSAPGPDDTYHWALITGPAHEVSGSRGMRYHAKQAVSEIDPLRSTWNRQVHDISMMPAAMILIRIMVAEISDAGRTGAVLEAVPVVQDDPRWTCRIWVKDALEALERDRGCLGARRLEWGDVEARAREYVEWKRETGRFRVPAPGEELRIVVPTYDLIEETETVA